MFDPYWFGVVTAVTRGRFLEKQGMEGRMPSWISRRSSSAAEISAATTTENGSEAAATNGVGAIGANTPKRHSQGVGCAVADEGVTMSYKYRTVRVRGTELVGTIARKHGSAAEIYETSKDLSTSVVPVFFEATGEIRFFDRSVLEDVVPAS